MRHHAEKALMSVMLIFSCIGSICTAQDVSYKMAGPYEVIARDGTFAHTKVGSERDMKAALDMVRRGQVAPAIDIIRAYAQTLQRLEGHDAPLCAIQCYNLLRAAHLLQMSDAEALPADVLADLRSMIHRALLPMIRRFDADSPYANGNWGAIVNRLRIVCALVLDDETLYDEAVDYHLHARDNGALPHYIAESGQCQETGRDQSHVWLGLGALCDICEMAYQHGDDLYAALDNRLLKGLEYTARYNLGHDVPFTTFTDCTGLYSQWDQPGEMGRGNIRCVFESAYRHYTQVKHLPMPYTAQLVSKQQQAEARGEITETLEARQFRVKGVKEGERLHRIFAYPAPEGAPLKHDYRVYIRPRSSNEWTEIDTYMARVNAPTTDGTHRISEISYAQFDFTGDVFVRVVAKNHSANAVRVRPDYRGVIARTLNDSTAEFMLFQPENISVEFDGDITDNLLIFTSRPPISRAEARQQAKRQGRRFVYYPAGLYTDADTIRVASNTTVYIEGGAYFTSTFAIDNADNVSILGRGIARPADGYQGCHIYNSRNVVVDGLTLNTCPIGGCADVKLHDVRSISYPGWGDGLNVFASHDVTFDRVFCRNSDDCTTAYASRKGFMGDCRNVTMLNSTLWADVAHPIFIGIHGNAERGDTIENLRYDNIDILCQSEPQIDYQGCLAINCGDNNLIRNVTFRNIRIEQIDRGALLHVKVGYNQKYCTAPGRGVENITFSGIRYTGPTPLLSIVTGYDKKRNVRNISFEEIKINGRLLHDHMDGKPAWYSTSDYVPMYVGPHVEGLVFSPDPSHTPTLRALRYCSEHVDRALETLRPYDFNRMPRNINDGQLWTLRNVSPEEWCSGFWPGILWMTFQYGRSEAVKKAAEGYTAAVIDRCIDQPIFDHDLGFIAISSLIKGYEATKSPLYKTKLLQAADSLTTLYNANVGTLLSWPRHVADYGGHNTIMDNMINLELLLWADSMQRASNPALQPTPWREIAVSHATITMQHHFRPDASTYHVAVYDPQTGSFLRGVTHQGLNDDSMWSRGQAWAIYGYTMVYRYTHDTRFLDQAQRAADAYLNRLHATSADNIPLWDMDAPEGAAKDASAAAIVASALIELHDYAPAKNYLDEAEKMLADLSSPNYLSGDSNVAFLQHSTGHHPAGSEIDYSIVYADYYYLEALLRMEKRMAKGKK